MKYKLKNNIEIEIREIQLVDAQKALEYMKMVNAETKNLTREPDEFNITLEQEEAFITRVVGSTNEFSYTVWHDDQLISISGFHGSALKRMNHRVNLGISVLKEYHNLGIGSLLMILLVEKAKEFGKAKMELEVRADNPNAIKVYERAGFEVEGRRKKGFKVDGNYVDLLLMGRDL